MWRIDLEGYHFEVSQNKDYIIMLESILGSPGSNLGPPIYGTTHIALHQIVPSSDVFCGWLFLVLSFC